MEQSDGLVARINYPISFVLVRFASIPSNRHIISSDFIKQKEVLRDDQNIRAAILNLPW
ncbi:hypothetical protein C0J52_12504 [Blattella germanica]|nr:hypothetical protein C0J52_12504 [Blattella germanica]